MPEVAGCVKDEHGGSYPNAMRQGISIAFIVILFFHFSPMIWAEEPDQFARLRERMVREQIVGRGVKNSKVLRAMRKVPRHLFVPQKQRAFAYSDYPLSIGEGQTISQPFIVAFMTEAIGTTSDDRVLEIGTGSGYQAAVLGELVKEVYTIEIIEKLGVRARNTLDLLGYKNIHVKIGDGFKGWPENAPFDAIIVTCAPEQIPDALVDQLREGGQMIIPVGQVGTVQKLVRATKKDGVLLTKEVMLVRFVPMIKSPK